MHEVSAVVEEARGGDGSGAEIDSPVHEGLRAADGEDDGRRLVDGHGLDDHGFGAHAPVGGDVGFFFFAGGLLVDLVGVLGGEADEGVGGEVAMLEVSGCRLLNTIGS